MNQVFFRLEGARLLDELDDVCVAWLMPAGLFVRVDQVSEYLGLAIARDHGYVAVSELLDGLDARLADDGMQREVGERSYAAMGTLAVALRELQRRPREWFENSSSRTADDGEKQP